MAFLAPESTSGENLGPAPYGIFKKPVNGRQLKDPAQDFGEYFLHAPDDKSTVSLIAVLIGAVRRNKDFFISLVFDKG